MYVNTPVVKALMHLRGVDESTLANLHHITLADLQAWLYEATDDADVRVPFETQIEVLRTLGIHDEAPRPDVVHYWRIHEGFFSRASSTYWALQTVLKAFGKAQAVFIARESDPSVLFSAKSVFGLRFAGFYAILEVTAHPLRSISFDPDEMTDISWLPDTLGVLLPEQEYLRLQPGAMRVKGLQQSLTYSAEIRQWERLRDAALEKGICAEQVAGLLAGSVPKDPLLTRQDEPAEEPVRPTAATADEAPTASAPPVTPLRAVASDGSVSPPRGEAAPQSPGPRTARQDVENLGLFKTPVTPVNRSKNSRVA